MSKPLKIIGAVLGVVSLVARFIPGGQAISAIAGLASVALGVAATAVDTLRGPPPARGSVSQMIVDPNAPQPYVMGEGYFAGALRHRAGYGPTISDVPNPYMFDVVVYSGGGPVQSITPQVDYGSVPAWYSGYLATDTQLGACPEASALTASYGTPTGWGSSYKLSGQAAIAWNYKFDKTGKKFASGLPMTGALIEGVKVYDPRLDSTFPGGSGSCTLGDETTYVYSENPALHAGTYAYGRYQGASGDKRTIGIGLPADAIDWEVIAAWANTCDANDWTIFGVLFEPADRWANLKDICAAGGGEPVPGGVLTFKYSAPAVALDTITEADIADEDMSAVAMQSYRDRINTILPKFRSPDHNWELIQAEAVSVSTYVTEDGETRPVEWPFNFVKEKDQAAQLAAYRLVDARELHPIELTCMPRLRAYRPGDCLHLDLPQLGLDHDAILLRREIDPATMKVKLTFMSETPEKHAYALGETGVAPPTPALGQTAEERDEVSGAVAETPGFGKLKVRNASIKNPSGRLLRAVELGSSITLHVAAHDWDYPDEDTDVHRGLGSILTLDDGVTDIPEDSFVYIYFDDATYADTSPTYEATLDPAEALNSNVHPDRHPLGHIATPLFGSGATNEADRSIGYGFES